MAKAQNLLNKQVGKYLILNEISRGGMGIIYLGKHATLNRYAAVKMLFPHLAGEINFVKRFREETKAMAKLKHPNIVDLYDYVEAFDTYFIIMEVVVGRSLESMLKESGPMDAEPAIDIIRQILKALESAHEKGVLHRDVKPSNIMVNDQGFVKVLDFGISKIIGGENLTQTGFMVGTPQYISPEQAQGAQVLAASDVYSAAIVLYEILAGQPPFIASTPVGVIMSHIKDAPPKPRKINPNIPPQLEKIILKGLEKKPGKRYASAREMLDALDNFKPSQTGEIPIPEEFLKDRKEEDLAVSETVIARKLESVSTTLLPNTQDDQETRIMPESSQETIQAPEADLDFTAEQTPIKTSITLSKWQKISLFSIGILMVVMGSVLGGTQSGRTLVGNSWNSMVSVFSKAETVEVKIEASRFAISADIASDRQSILGIKFVKLAACTFMMGAKPGTTGSLDDSPDHEVRLDSFFISKYEITYGQYQMFIMDMNRSLPSSWPENTDQFQNKPVTSITWVEAYLYCKWLSSKTGLKFRLPTEAEWERAAYSSGIYPWGDRYKSKMANTSDSGQNSPVDVGTFSDDRSLAGVCDMGGNVREWIQDYYSMSVYATSKNDNPSGPSTGSKRVLRGGSFKRNYKDARVTRRDSHNPHKSADDIGFRIVLSVNR